MDLVREVQIHELFRKFQDKYGGLCTIWLGGEPNIVIGEWELMHEALVTKRADFIGRKQNLLARILADERTNLMCMDYSPAWEVLRKVAHSALRTFMANKNLPMIISENVDNAVNKMIKIKGPLDPEEYIRLSVSNIIATSAFGKRFDPDDLDFKNLKEAPELIFQEAKNGLPADLFPALRVFFLHGEMRLRHGYQKFLKVLYKEYNSHVQSYKEGTIRDFTDSILAAREEAKREGKLSSHYLTDDALSHIVVTLFGGGYKLPKRTSMLFNLTAPHLNEEYWPNPRVFKPERFLDADGNLTKARLVGFVPFGLGRRQCPGEKLSYCDIFLILSRLLQRCHVTLLKERENDLQPQPFGCISIPRNYEILVIER
ncbi:cytochrome P450 1A1-like [Limulus polyphemus]|uniref:Cytochrome P450 1A1-like n=1 Tax=Limulus polyphemus TaxID=6850 RepID=A0ABM1T785_LIMPO|nr:cytochrome P450 1A1-like [Limulus polyphemus]